MKKKSSKSVKGKKRYAKKSKGGSYPLVRSKQLFVLPPRLRTKESLSMTGSISVGLLPTLGTYFVTYANSIYQPFNTASATMAGAFTLTQGTSLVNNPIGYTILSSQYGRYKVTNVRYELSVVIGNNTDSMAVYMYPFVWATGTAGLNPFNGQAQPGCKYKVCNQSGASSSDNHLVASYNIRKYLGMTKAQYDGQQDTYKDQTPTQLLGVSFAFETLNATTNAQPVSIDLKAIYTVEWSQPIVLLN